MSFTPGPWRVTGTLTKYVEASIGNGFVQEVAAVGPTEADNGYGPQQTANATLISAAPDLLEALEAIINDGIHCDVVPHLHTKAMEAIKKARG